MGLLVDRVPGRHEGHHVGDRVVHDVAVAVGLEVHRLVEVHRPDGVDGHELQVGEVLVREPRGRRGLLGGLLHLVGNSRESVLLLLDGRDPARSRRSPLLGLQHPVPTLSPRRRELPATPRRHPRHTPHGGGRTLP